MAISIFKAFRSTVNPPQEADWFTPIKVLKDKDTGAPVGLKATSANGADAMWVPTDVTAAQIASPPAEMLADLNATYRLNEPPYTRYHSDGTSLVAMGGDANPITLAQVANPGAALLSDTNTTYQLTTAPYTQFRSDGEAMIATDGSNIVPATGLLSNRLAISALHITGVIPQHIRGTLHIRA